jgi:hypothetical protein
VNKTIILSDSVKMQNIETGIREGIAELFWGYKKEVDGKAVWESAARKPTCSPPEEPLPQGVPEGAEWNNYFQYCKDTIADKAARKQAIASFDMVGSPSAKKDMHELLAVAMNKMELPTELRGSRQAQDAGLKGATLLMFPALFHLVAHLLRTERRFAILFRSFGTDHDKIRQEWNAFCEARHPVFSHLLQGIGRIDGSQGSQPDRRIHGTHTLYRDADGPILMLDTFTNGPEEATWDAWARSKPPPKTDARNGRQFIKSALKSVTVEGIPDLQQWMKRHLMSQSTAAIKDDWAWWQWHGEQASAGKLLTIIGGDETDQIFFDDNIDHSDARIVDCRDAEGRLMKAADCLNRFCVKVNPVEALLDEGYFLSKLQRCHGDPLEVEASLCPSRQQFAEGDEPQAKVQSKEDTPTSKRARLT